MLVAFFLVSLILAISLIYTWKMKKKLLFFPDYPAILLIKWKKPGKEPPNAQKKGIDGMAGFSNFFKNPPFLF